MDMREMETSMTQKGQVTIPFEIRSRLGLKPKDKVRFVVEGDAVTIKPVHSRIERHFGAVKGAGQTLDWRDEREAFEQGMAEEAEDRD
jgi:AbrB family looped-hinge helix DNA binding protein